MTRSLLVFIFVFYSCSQAPPKKKTGRSIASFNSRAVKIKQFKTKSRIVAASKTANVQIDVEESIISICGMKFSQISYKTDHSNYLIDSKLVPVKGSKLNVILPDGIKNMAEYADVQFAPTQKASSFVSKYTLLPDIPILPDGLGNQECEDLKNYKKSVSSQRSRHQSALGSSRFSRGRLVFRASRRMNTNLMKILVKQNLKDNAAKEMILTKIVKPAPIQQYKYLVIYDQEYASEASDIRSFRGSQGIPTKITSIQNLPGYNANDPTPVDCAGDFLKECYHYWGDTVEGVSQRAVPSLDGFHSQTKVWQQYTRVSFVPGLIRAYIRKMKRENPLQAVLLVGSPKKIPSIMVNKAKYGHGGSAYYKGKLNTDLFYMLPDIKMPVTTKLNHLQISPMLWSCKNSATQEVSLKYWCESNENRHWPTPALTAYRWSPFVPLTRIMQKPTSLNNADYQAISKEDIIPVGRIITQDNIINGHDDVVEHYVQKMQRWQQELPAMHGNSIASHGGSTTDHWIYTADDINIFENIYGTNSKIYASEFFTPSTKCDGRCIYDTADNIHSEIAIKNRVSFFQNGHGGHTGIQGPYGNGDIASGYSTEDYWRIGGGIKLTHSFYPQDNTHKVLENGGKLIGHAFANSCSPSNFNLTNEMSVILTQMYPGSSQRSYAEELIKLEDAGALNTYFNNDVGWGGSDNAYNKKFMLNVYKAWDACGNIGDALVETINDMIHGDTAGAGEWQVINRQFLGSPLNPIARKPWKCHKIIADHLQEAKD